MPKRKTETREDKWRRKMRKYEEKLAKPRRRRQIIYSEDEIEIEDLENNVDDDVCDGGYDDTMAPAFMAPPGESPTLNDAGTADTPQVENPPPLLDDQGTIDPELIKALGDFTDESVEWGTEINSDLAKRWETILRDGLKKEIREEIVRKHLVPTNCRLIQIPKLNPEIAAMLTESTKNRDTRVSHKQAQLGCALTILGTTISKILLNQCEKTEVIRGLSEVGRVLTDSHYLETETRRSLITPVIDKTFIDAFKERKRDTFLFGDQLGDFIKSSRGIRKTGQMIQPPAVSSNLNWKGPPARSAQQYRPRGGAAPRGGGYRTATSAQTTRRRAPPPPPPPAAPRRAPASATTQIPASAARYPAVQRRNR